MYGPFKSAARRFAQSETRIARELFRLCTAYIHAYEHFDYDIATNGEQRLAEVVFGRAKNTEQVVAIDCGANQGDWIRVVLDINPEAKLHCFEIAAPAQDRLEAKFGKCQNVILNRFGLSEQEGSFRYKDYGPLSGLNTLLMNASFHDRDVQHSICSTQLSSGDRYLSQNGIRTVRFLKIDTEGSEFKVMQGFSESLDRRVIEVVQFEYGYTHGDAKTLMRDFYDFFSERGYAVGKLTRYGVRFAPFTYHMNNFESGPNYVAALPEWVSYLRQF